MGLKAAKRRRPDARSPPALAEGPEAGLVGIDALEDGRLEGYHLFHAVRADLLRRLGRADEARAPPTAGRASSPTIRPGERFSPAA